MGTLKVTVASPRSSREMPVAPESGKTLSIRGTAVLKRQLKSPSLTARRGPARRPVRITSYWVPGSSPSATSKLSVLSLLMKTAPGSSRFRRTPSPRTWTASAPRAAVSRGASKMARRSTSTDTSVLSAGGTVSVSWGMAVAKPKEMASSGRLPARSWIAADTSTV